MSAREELFAKLMAIRRNWLAAADREAAKVKASAAPATPPPSVASPSAVQAQPAQPIEPKSAKIISLQEAGLKAGIYIPHAGGQSIADEGPPDPVTANWRATLDQTPRQFSPDSVDATCGDAVSRAFTEQVRISKEQNRK
jgi:hypothetical protein